MEAPSTVLLAPTRARLRQRQTLRIFALLGFASFCVLFPEVGPHRLGAAAALLALIPIPAVLGRLVPNHRRIVTQSAVDTLAAVVVVGFLPNVWAAGLVIVVCSPAASAALLGRRSYVLITAFGLAGMGVAAHLSHVEGWRVPLAVAVLMIPLVVSYVDIFVAQQIATTSHLDELAHSSSAMFWELDAGTGEFLAVTGPVPEVLGYQNDDLPRELASVLVDEDHGLFWERALESEDDSFELECRAHHSDGHVVWLRLHVRRMTVKGRPVLRGTAFDISELVAVHEEVRRRAETDSLTGLANRAVLLRDLEEREAAGHRFALFVIDLDRFKDVNDTLGHQAGDEFLRSMAERLAFSPPPNTMIARMGGDEFAVVFEVTTGLDAVLAFADELIDRCEQAVRVGGLEFTGSASCGVAIAPDHGSTAEDLLRRADLAMYAAKRSGTGVHLFEYANDEAKVSRLQISAEAESALDRSQMRLWFQPKVELGSGRLVGAEALLRWHHPERGILVPAEFLDVVELSRHRWSLCREVITQGVDFIARARNAGHDLQVAVNVSLRDLVDPDFVALTTGALADAGVAASQLVLEITERELMDDRTGFERAATAARSIGVELAIDDFGTGHSSLLRLHQLPVTELKIDRSFVSALGTDPDAGIIVRSIVELGRALGHRVVAEGIEHEHESRILRELGCTVGQGFLFSPAVPVDDFTLLLDAPSYVVAP